MAHIPDLIATDIEQYLRRTRTRACCASSPAAAWTTGKSTLIGRLLYESKMLFEDQLAAVEAELEEDAHQGEAIDFALLVNSLAAEREQGRHDRRGVSLLLHRQAQVHRRRHPGHGDAPQHGHRRSTADAAILMVDRARASSPRRGVTATW